MKSKGSLPFVSVEVFTLSQLATRSSLPCLCLVLPMPWYPFCAFFSFCFACLFTLSRLGTFFFPLGFCMFVLYAQLPRDRRTFQGWSREMGYVIGSWRPPCCFLLVVQAKMTGLFYICSLNKKLEAIIDFIKPEILTLIDSCNSVRKATSFSLTCEYSGTSF